MAYGKEGSDYDKYTVAYVVPNGQTTTEQIQDGLKPKLAEYIRPNYIVLIDRYV